ncbi:MAG: quinone-dependent dihydroorotate dehydrogenase [Cytophagia bacterium]|nr:quinone-dependent dihydroorotate dehydrogenase [Cytophagia bacterium]
MYRWLQGFLFGMEPESAHYLTLNVSRALLKIPGMSRLWALLWPKVSDPWDGMGLAWPNRLGLAAGFDKDAKYLQVWKALGFGFVEVGTLTPRPQPGNPKPRLFRLVTQQALLNRLGFNNGGVEAAIPRLRQRPKGLVVGANIGKNKDTPNQDAAKDYVTCVEVLHPWVDYFTINLSSPNTPGLRDLQEAGFLDSLLEAIDRLPCQQQLRRPVWVKLAPDLAPEDWQDLWPVFAKHRIQGLVLTNTTIDRGVLGGQATEVASLGAGGLSGAPLGSKSLALLESMKAYGTAYGFCPLLVSVGGVMSGRDAAQRLAAGAVLVQVYTGLVYRGPALVEECVTAMRS